MTPKEYFTKKSFCTLPWLGLLVQPNGIVRNCAISKDSIGDINQTPLHDILHGQKNQEIKQDMLNDVFHDRCSQCHTLEKNQPNTMDQVSNRVWYLKTLPIKDLDFFDNVDNHRLKMLDLRWKNTCNFACVYCGPDLSSAWAAELNRPQHISDSALEQSLNYIYDNIHTVDHVYLAGGEPLLIKENLNLLNKLYEVNPNVSIRINTNLSVINNDIYNQIKKFKNVHWTISVDNIKEQFEYVRFGGKWKTFVTNLDQLRQDFEKINFNLVWFVLNGTGIFDCIDFLAEQGFHENTIIVNPLEYPTEWHINNLPTWQLEKIKNQITERIKSADPKYSLYNSLNLMLNYIGMPFEKNINSTWETVKILDQRRKLDSRKVFKELYQLREEE